MELLVLLVSLSCVFTPVVYGQVDFSSMLNSLGFGGGSSMPGSSSCPYQPHPNRFKFQQMVNNRMMTQDCAPGTMFDINKCSCVTSTKTGPEPMPGSNPRLQSPFGGSDPGGNPLLAMLKQMTGGGSPPNMPPRMGPPPPSRQPGRPPFLSSPMSMGGSGRAQMKPPTRKPTPKPRSSSVPSPSIGGTSGMDAFAALLGGGSGSSGGFGGTGSPDINSLLRSIAGPSSGSNMFGGSLPGSNPFGGSSSGSSNNMGAMASMMGAMGAAGMMGATAPGAPPIDMTNFFNSQGRMGMGMSSFQNINMIKLQELDRQGVIDISDLTPQGLMAANAHFAG